MTLSKRSFIDPADILSLHLCCQECQSTMTLPIGNLKTITPKCPNCSTQWYTLDSADVKAVMDFINNIKTLQARGKKSPVTLQIEITAPT